MLELDVRQNLMLHRRLADVIQNRLSVAMEWEAVQRLNE